MAKAIQHGLFHCILFKANPERYLGNFGRYSPRSEGVVPLIFNSLFSALVLIQIISNFLSLLSRPFYACSMNFK